MSKTQAKQIKKMEIALQYFTKHLKENFIKGDIFKIILYGSLLEKKIHSGSDIDLAIIAKNPKKIEDLIDDLAYNTVLKYGELIEPIIYSLKQYKTSRSPFLQKILQEGREVYSQ